MTAMAINQGVLLAFTPSDTQEVSYPSFFFSITLHFTLSCQSNCGQYQVWFGLLDQCDFSGSQLCDMILAECRILFSGIRNVR